MEFIAPVLKFGDVSSRYPDRMALLLAGIRLRLAAVTAYLPPISQADRSHGLRRATYGLHGLKLLNSPNCECDRVRAESFLLLWVNV